MYQKLKLRARKASCLFSSGFVLDSCYIRVQSLRTKLVNNMASIAFLTGLNLSYYNIASEPIVFTRDGDKRLVSAWNS